LAEEAKRHHTVPKFYLRGFAERHYVTFENAMDGLAPIYTPAVG
jgi:hypothetical protein